MTLYWLQQVGGVVLLLVAIILVVKEAHHQWTRDKPREYQKRAPRGSHRAWRRGNTPAGIKASLEFLKRIARR